MIYYILLELLISYDDLVSGTIKLLSADDLRQEIFSLDICALVDGDLDNLVVAIDPNVVIPTTVNVIDAAKDFKYKLEKDVVDTIELASLMTLVANLNK